MNTFSPPAVSVIMPTFEQAAFISRAIISLEKQVFTDWELIIIDDGSRDNTIETVTPFLIDSRIKLIRNQHNMGLGKCLNLAIRHSTASVVSYLPSDDIYHKDHLSSLYQKLHESPDNMLAFSGIRHHYNRSCEGQIPGFPLQLVQVMHRKTHDRWIEREELVTDDLERMFWSKLSGTFVNTGVVSCEWVDHPHQMHKIIQEPIGGINPYKQRYRVASPLRFHSTTGNYIDEISYYEPFRARPQVDAQKGLKILLVGELAYNPERILSLEERGHKLYGLWMREPYWYNFVGPLPFGNVEDVPHENWKQRVEQIQPDVIYALLNWQAVPFCRDVMIQFPDIPFVWHFKEGPFICLEKGSWKELIDLYTDADGRMYSSPEMQDWFEQFIPVDNQKCSMVLDGDLPKQEWFSNERSAPINVSNQEIHTVVPGRPIGLHPHTVAELAQHHIHLHFYGDFTHGQWKEWIVKTKSMAPEHLHIHPNCSQDKWVSEFSKYDAGWLHFFKSENNGELMRANWDDLNYPARMATLACAGLPMLQRNNDGHIVATQSIVKKHDIGLFFNSMSELATQLFDKDRMQQLRANVWNVRHLFSFDHYTDELIDFFREVISRKSKEPQADTRLQKGAAAGRDLAEAAIS